MSKNCLSWSVFAVIIGLAACQSPTPENNSTLSPEPSPEQTVSASPQSPATEETSQGTLIDDLEDKDASNALGGGWFTYDDKTQGGDSQVSPSGQFTPSQEGANNSSESAKMTGKVTKTFPYGTIAMGTTLNAEGKPIDINQYKGIEFWAKGDGKEYRLQVVSPSKIKDYNYYNYILTTQPEWTRYEVRFDEMKQEDWGDKTVSVPLTEALSEVTSIVWQTFPLGQPRENVELAVDDIKFIE